MQETYFNHIPERFLPLFEPAGEPWEAIGRLEGAIANMVRESNKAEMQGNVFIRGPVEIGEGSIIEHGAVIIGPVILGKNCRVRAGAYIRGMVIAGDDCVIGHTSEVIRSILFDRVRVDHFNYVGDSILGNDVHFGAGAKVANVRFDGAQICVDGKSTGRKKFGVILGDRCQLGVNVTIGPGVIMKPGIWYADPETPKSAIYAKSPFMSTSD